MCYEYGDFKIKKQKLKDFLKNKVGKGQYTTYDILEKYQGTIKVNKGISGGSSHNAYFGKILKQCEKDTNGSLIKEVESNKEIDVDGEKTENSLWEIL